MVYYGPDAKMEYDKEYKWAEKVLSNTLTKKERREFWRKFTIPNPHLEFRTFSSSERDLIPAANPLLTTEECKAPNFYDPSIIAQDIEMKMEKMRNPFMSRLSLPEINLFGIQCYTTH